MTLIFYKLFAALIILLISVVSIIPPIRKMQHLHDIESLHIGEALASGIFLGAAFFHMLPEAAKNLHVAYPHIDYPLAEGFAMIGFVLLLFLERLAVWNPRFSTEEAIPYLLALILMIHAITEGAALGISNSYTEAIMLFIAIVAHKASATFALCMTLIRYHLTLRLILILTLTFCVMTPLGIGLGASISFWSAHKNNVLTEGLLNAFAAGTFLYISTLHHTHSHQHEGDKQGMIEFLSLVGGLGMMAIVAVWT